MARGRPSFPPDRPSPQTSTKGSIAVVHGSHPVSVQIVQICSPCLPQTTGAPVQVSGTGNLKTRFVDGFALPDSPTTKTENSQIFRKNHVQVSQSGLQRTMCIPMLNEETNTRNSLFCVGSNSRFSFVSYVTLFPQPKFRFYARSLDQFNVQNAKVQVRGNVVRFDLCFVKQKSQRQTAMQCGGVAEWSKALR